MRLLRHENIVSVIGVAAVDLPLMIVMELCPNGSLLSQLRAGKLKGDQKAKFDACVDAAAGLKYLESESVIHRDVAARNCLLGPSNQVKLSDFGLAAIAPGAVTATDGPQEKSAMVTGGVRLPIKWLAPEVLRRPGTYSTKSDVWSFGVLLWEVWSDGAEPYPGKSNAETKKAVVFDGYRLPMPPGTPAGLPELAADCWRMNATARPSFAIVHGRMFKLRHDHRPTSKQ